MALSIGVVADFDGTSVSHQATNAALQHSAAAAGVEGELRVVWFGTDEIGAKSAASLFAELAGIWIGPGSPYKSMEGALAAVSFGRKTGLPTLGTCGGFQHMIIEAARNVLGIDDAEHEESAPGAARLCIRKLVCSLAGRTMAISLAAESGLRRIYNDAASVEEEYLCNFGVAPEFEASVRDAGFTVAASDREGIVRAIELPSHPFYYGTLFLPQHRSSREKPHPLVTAFLAAAARSRGSG